MPKQPKHQSVAIADEEKLGPAMKALNPRQRAFVDAMFVLGMRATYADAARAAGYKNDSETGLRVQAHRLAHGERVQAAFREEAERRSAGLLPVAHAAQTDILTNPTHPDHFRAVKHVQALAGVAPKMVHIVEHKTDRASMLQELTGFLQQLQAMTGNTVIDVTPAVENEP